MQTYELSSIQNNITSITTFKFLTGPCASCRLINSVKVLKAPELQDYYRHFDINKILTVTLYQNLQILNSGFSLSKRKQHSRHLTICWQCLCQHSITAFKNCSSVIDAVSYGQESITTTLGSLIVIHDNVDLLALEERNILDFTAAIDNERHLNLTSMTSLFKGSNGDRISSDKGYSGWLQSVIVSECSDKWKWLNIDVTLSRNAICHAYSAADRAEQNFASLSFSSLFYNSILTNTVKEFLFII